MSTVGDLLQAHLSCVVPLRIAELQRSAADPQDPDAVEGEWDRWIRTLAAHSDELQFGGDHGRAALWSVVEAVAHLAFAPSGIDFCGCHFEALWTPVRDGRRRVDQD